MGQGGVFGGGGWGRTATAAPARGLPLSGALRFGCRAWPSGRGAEGAPAAIHHMHAPRRPWWQPSEARRGCATAATAGAAAAAPAASRSSIRGWRVEGGGCLVVGGGRGEGHPGPAPLRPRRWQPPPPRKRLHGREPARPPSRLPYRHDTPPPAAGGRRHLGGQPAAVSSGVGGGGGSGGGGGGGGWLTGRHPGPPPGAPLQARAAACRGVWPFGGGGRRHHVWGRDAKRRGGARASVRLVRRRCGSAGVAVLRARHGGVLGWDVAEGAWGGGVRRGWSWLLALAARALATPAACLLWPPPRRGGGWWTSATRPRPRDVSVAVGP